MSLFNNKRLILAKAEVTYGTDPVPVAGTDDVLVNANITLTPLSQDYASRNLIRPYYGNSAQIPTNTHVMLNFEVELAGQADLGVPIAGVSALLKAVAVAETITDDTSIEYDLISASFGSATIYFNLDGVLHKLTGARGSPKLSMTLNQIPVLQFSFVGLFNAVTDTAAGSPDFSAFQTPLTFEATNTSVFTLHAVSPVVQALTLDLANTLVFRSLVGGTKQVLITGRAPKGSITIENTPVATKNWYSIIAAATTGALAVTHGPAGNQVVIGAPKVQLTNAQLSDDNGISMLQMDLYPLPDSGNDEISLTYQ